MSEDWPPPSLLKDGLTNTVMKALRAQRHLKGLQDEIRMFLGPEAVTCTEQSDIENGVHIFRFELRDIPVEIPLLVGEFAYNLRSGLDQMVWQLALLGRSTPARNTAFPIHSDRHKGSEDRFRRVTWDVPCEAVAIIKSLQPYERGEDFNRHPLWRLNTLCTIDKHVTIPVNSTMLTLESGPPDIDERFIPEELDNGVKVIVPIVVKDK